MDALGQHRGGTGQGQSQELQDGDTEVRPQGGNNRPWLPSGRNDWIETYLPFCRRTPTRKHGTIGGDTIQKFVKARGGHGKPRPDTATTNTARRESTPRDDGLTVLAQSVRALSHRRGVQADRRGGTHVQGLR